jgi:hypothetical protein
MRPSRWGTRQDKISVSVAASAALRRPGPVSMVRWAAFSAAVKEIRSGSRPAPAAARTMMARMAW